MISGAPQQDSGAVFASTTEEDRDFIQLVLCQVFPNQFGIQGFYCDRRAVWSHFICCFWLCCSAVLLWSARNDLRTYKTSACFSISMEMRRKWLNLHFLVNWSFNHKRSIHFPNNLCLTALSFCYKHTSIMSHSAVFGVNCCFKGWRNCSQATRTPAQQFQPSAVKPERRIIKRQWRRSQWERIQQRRQVQLKGLVQPTEERKKKKGKQAGKSGDKTPQRSMRQIKGKGLQQPGRLRGWMWSPWAPRIAVTPLHPDTELSFNNRHGIKSH